MTQLAELMLRAATKVLEAKTMIWERERALLDGLTRVPSDARLPDNYWQPEHNARMEMESAARFLAVITEEIHAQRERPEAD